MEVRKICIVGAGMMGHQVTQLAAMTGHEVAMADTGSKIIQDGLAKISGNLKKFYVDKDKMTQGEADAIFGRIKGYTDLKEAVKGAQVVIENTPEVLELKQQVFKELDEVCPSETILASNTSGLMITAIATLTKRPERVAGMHFFNPVTVMRLIEVVRGAKTSDEAHQDILDLSAKFGKETITVNDSPGFAITRLYTILLNEAARLVHEGVCTPADIDKGCQLGLGHAMGPLKTADLTNGIGTSVHILDYLREILGDEYKASPLLRKKFLAGELGVWAGKGFYDHGS